ncbi:MAG: TolB family protein [Vallitaleaceae bacterium]|nr:TolB family protein [Vallitaleaceae bacterium]
MDRETLLNYMNNRKQQCALEIYEISSGKRQVLASFNRVVEAPNWTKDGKTLIYNSEGLIYRFDLKTKTSEIINTDFADLCNNDHVLSSNEKFLAISHSELEDLKSRIYIVPIEGGTPKRITKLGPSYLHGWSPDGKHLAYCAERDGNYDVYTISVDGENETRLTFTHGLDDGPEYDPKGEKIWFNSTRSGLMQVWSMNTDGSEQTQISQVEMNCWFPHVSPDGSQVVYLAYHVGDLKPEEHLPDKRVQIRLMDSTGENDRLLFDLSGGQGTINVNSWSPDGKYFAFVSY